MKVGSLSCLCVLASLGHAQVWQTPGSGTADSNSCCYLAGSVSEQRQQFLVAAPLLSGANPRIKEVTGIVFRRESSMTDAMLGGKIAVEVYVSSLGVDPKAPSERFIANAVARDRVLAFKGEITLPSSPKFVPGTSDVWAANNTITITFSRPFKYGQKGLCVDVVGKPGSTKLKELWLLDAVEQSAKGQVRSIGKSCSTLGYPTLQGNEMTALVGATNNITGFGKPAPQPLRSRSCAGRCRSVSDRSEGCSLYVVPSHIVALPYAPPAEPGLPAVLYHQQQIPSLSPLMGAKVYVQLADNETALPRKDWTNRLGLVTSNAVEITIGATPITLGMAIVTSPIMQPNQPPPAKGSVIVNRGPVMRVLYK